jgi:hypothetical protein
LGDIHESAGFAANSKTANGADKAYAFAMLLGKQGQPGVKPEDIYLVGALAERPA